MAIRTIVKHPDPILREKAMVVTKFNSNLHKLLDDMADTMYDADGVGLAAPQVGISKRVIVMDCGEGLIEIVNPEIVDFKGEQFDYPEGCLSIPGLRGDVRRHMWIKLRGQDRNGNPIELEADDLLSRCSQHEIDHLNGVLFIDVADKVYQISPDEEGE
ncbi:MULTISPECIES: peptide deformylase [Brevibacillus]|jgi:peptide deformylase|uniref:Peptide deformylase n=2 Tax=Brevibacillus TaxID=55080 RepID=A0A1I3TAH6_9BACL|nr:MULTISPECIES: peptide deformylase [Brevibacillus]MEC2128280.1 peptide deformylase [Brevibacillus centrosporus]MED1794235.1 peptide deformylase [Brevibacillus nitrificans]MED1953918.1 peptide deformylase [Brevibacillus centrosporus]MED4909702.1 peptide deformylase [Brevibacillus centrosporus]RNB73867.1 peptide deformylase [Brevibacillus centrosporus]